MRFDVRVRAVEVYPSYKVTLTNLDTDESLGIVIPGAWFIGGTEVGTGPWLWRANPEAGEPGLFLIRGRWVQDGDQFTFVGHAVDLCAEFAPE